MLHAGIFGGLVCGTYSEDLAGFSMTDGAMKMVDMFWDNGNAVRVLYVQQRGGGLGGGDAFSWGSLLVRCGDGDGDVDVDMCGHEDACIELHCPFRGEKTHSKPFSRWR